MKVTKYRISLFSGDPDRLSKYYTEVLGFKQLIKIDREDDYGYALEVAPGYKLWIARHSEVKGRNSDSFRIMISLYVDDIHAYFEKVKAFDSTLIIEAPIVTCSNIPGEERYAGSFYDVDGNCIQMMQLTGR